MAQTVNINIPNPGIVFNEAFLPFIRRDEAAKKPLIIMEGGRGSGKSKAIAQMKVLQALRTKTRFALVRKVADTIRDSIYQEIKDVVEQWNLQQYFTFIASPLSIRVASGSEFICKGLDKAEKFKSVANVDDVVIEEATELTKEDWQTVRFTIRGKTQDDDPKQITLVFNRQLGHWTEEYFNADGTFREQPHIYHLHTTFLDNKFLDEQFIKELNELKAIDPALYDKIALGLPVALKGLIFTNWDIVETFPDDRPDIGYGLDFGFNDPMVLLKIGVREREVWIDEQFYHTGKITVDLIKELPTLLHNTSAEIIADSADPGSIKQIYDAGYNVRECVKGIGSVYAGLMFCKGYKLHITARSVRTRKDFENYKWKEDKNGNALEEPMHTASHAPDALRYYLYTKYYTPSITQSDVRAVHVEELESIGIGESY